MTNVTTSRRKRVSILVSNKSILENMKRWWWWDWTVTELYEMKSEKRRGSYLLIPAPMFHNKDKKGHYYNNIILWVWVWIFSFKINYFHVNVLSRHMDPWIMDNFKHGQIYTWYLQTTCILNWTIQKHTNVDGWKHGISRAKFFFFDFLIFLGLLVIEMRDIGIGSV